MLRELGFAGLELGESDAADAEPAMRRDQLAGHGLTLWSVSPDCAGQHLLDARDPADYLARFRAGCALALALGAHAVRIDTVQPPAIHRADDYRDLLARLVRAWDRCIGLAGDLGLAVAWEPRPDRAFNKPADVQRVLERLQQDRFGVRYDTGHAQALAVLGIGQEGPRETLRGGQAELVARLAGRIGEIVIADCDEAADLVAPGEGTLPLAELAGALAAAAPEVEWWGVAPPAPDALAPAKTVLDGLIGQTQ